MTGKRPSARRVTRGGRTLVHVGALGTVARGAVALAVASAALFVLLGPEGTGKELFYIGCLVVAAAVAWVGAERQPVGNRLIPRLIAAGLTSSALGDVLWYAIVWSGSEPNVSIADLPWFASYVFLGAGPVGGARADPRPGPGGLRLGARRPDHRDRLPAVRLDDLGRRHRRGHDGVAVRAHRVGGATRWPTRCCSRSSYGCSCDPRPAPRSTCGSGSASTCWLLADTAYLILEPTTTVESATNAVYVLAAALMAHATWRPPPSAMPVTTRAQDTSRGYVAQLMLAIVPLLVPPVLEAVTDLHGPAGGAAGAPGRHRPRHRPGASSG